MSPGPYYLPALGTLPNIDAGSSWIPAPQLVNPPVGDTLTGYTGTGGGFVFMTVLPAPMSVSSFAATMHYRGSMTANPFAFIAGSWVALTDTNPIPWPGNFSYQPATRTQTFAGVPATVEAVAYAVLESNQASGQVFGTDFRA